MGNRGKSRSKVVGLPTSGNVKVIVYRPVCYEETQSIIDNLKSRKSVIVNMEDLEISCAQRILDFMSGAIYALNGTIFKVSKGIFVVAPMNVDVVGNDREDEAAGEGY
jgi:cell division inhibitor SepF